jgi:hypothetical protein
MPVRQIKAAQQQFRFGVVMLELRALFRRQKAHYRREILFLIEVEKYFAVMGIPDNGRFCNAVTPSCRLCEAGSDDKAPQCGRDGVTAKQRSLPFFYGEFGLLLRYSIGDFQFQVFRADSFVEIHRRPAPVLTGIWSVPDEDGDEFVFADFEVTHVHPMDTATEQGAELTLRIQIVRDFPAVDLQVDGIEFKILADVHRDEKGNLGVRRKKQFFLEKEEIPVQREYFVFQRLNVVIKTSEFA